VELRVPRGERVEHAEVLHFFEREIVAREVEPRINEHGTVTSAENEAVAIEPVAVGRVTLEGFAEEDCPDFGGPERKPEVTGRTLVDGVHGETTGFIGGFGEDGVVHGTLESGRWKMWLKSDGSGRESTDGESVSGETPPEGKRPSLRERRRQAQGECAGGGGGSGACEKFHKFALPLPRRGGIR
jgi:hypothetical protein